VGLAVVQAAERRDLDRPAALFAIWNSPNFHYKIWNALEIADTFEYYNSSRFEGR